MVGKTINDVNHIENDVHVFFQNVQ